MAWAQRSMCWAAHVGHHADGTLPCSIPLGQCAGQSAEVAALPDASAVRSTLHTISTCAR